MLQFLLHSFFFFSGSFFITVSTFSFSTFHICICARTFFTHRAHISLLHICVPMVSLISSAACSSRFQSSITSFISVQGFTSSFAFVRTFFFSAISCTVFFTCFFTFFRTFFVFRTALFSVFTFFHFCFFIVDSASPQEEIVAVANNIASIPNPNNNFFIFLVNSFFIIKKSQVLAWL